MTSNDIGFAGKTLEEPARPRPANTSANQSYGLGLVKGKDAIERTFSPEFRNRLDAWVVFNQLGHDHILQVVDKFISEVKAQLVEKNVTLELTASARKWLGTKGFDKLYGARPMSRLIQQKLRHKLADELLFGKLEHGGHVVVTEKDGDLVVDCADSNENSRTSESANIALKDDCRSL